MSISGGTQFIRVHKSGSNVNLPFQLSGLTWDDQNSYIINFDQGEPTSDSVLITYTVTGFPTGCVTTMNTSFVRPLFSIYGSSNCENIYHGDYTGIILDALNQCQSTWQALSDPVTYTLSIISGAQYSTLVNTQTSDTGMTLYGVHQEGGFSNQIAFVATGGPPDSVVQTQIQVGASDPRVAPAEIVINVLPPTVVSIDPPEIAPGDTATIMVVQWNPNGTLSNFPPDQTFEVGIVGEDTYGTILCGGDTASYFIDVTQPFQFIAADSINADSVMVGIRVGVQTAQCWGVPSSILPGGKVKKSPQAQISHGVYQKGNTATATYVQSSVIKSSTESTTMSASKKNSKSVSDESAFSWGDYGIGYVTIEKQILKIINHAPWSIWPDLPPGTITSKETYPPGYNPKRGFTISVMGAEGNPVPNAEVEIRHDYQEGTGGHAHGASNDLTPGQFLQGTFYGQSGSGPSLSLTTDANGIAIVDSLVASQISGTYLITAHLVSDPSIMDTVNLNVQVPALAHFGDWILFPTGDPVPYTFSQSTTGNANHPNNDYCTIAMGDSLVYAICKFYDWSESKEGGRKPFVISINDISLPWGGVFDINDTWEDPHQLHRIGHSVDINNTGPFQIQDPKRPKDKNARILTKKGKELVKVMWDNGKGHKIPEPNSVHFEFDKEF